MTRDALEVRNGCSGRRESLRGESVLGRYEPMQKLTTGVAIAAVLVVGLSIAFAKGVFTGSATSADTPSSAARAADLQVASQMTTETRQAGLVAMEKAAADKKYLFAFFWKDEDNATTAMKKVFETATQKVAERANTVAVCVSDRGESGIVKKFGVDRAPMPLVLAIAPNGAVTGGFPSEFTEEELVNAFASPALAQCMKPMQEGKLVLLCVQNDTTKLNAEALQGVQEFKAEARLANAVEIVMLDPSDSAEASFLGDLKIDPKTATAVTAFLVPPGSVVAEFEGATNKEQLLAALQTAGSCGPGGACGPGGCGPR